MIKAIRLFLLVNDATDVNFARTRRLTPNVRRFAPDRISTDDELRKIVENAGLRGKALTLTPLSSGIREGAVETQKAKHLHSTEFEEAA